jgi:hypothetical protein
MFYGIKILGLCLLFSGHYLLLIYLWIILAGVPRSFLTGSTFAAFAPNERREWSQRILGVFGVRTV